MFSFLKPPLSSYQTEIRQFIIVKFGVKPKTFKYYEEALRHKSIARDLDLPDNERLEFLGDAILDSIVAEDLFLRYQDIDEGKLTQMKSRMVSRDTLGQLGVKIGLVDLIKFVDGKYVRKATICGNALEAVIGAIYLDLGFSKTCTAIQKIYAEHLNIEVIMNKNHDYKSQVLVWSQRSKQEIQFKLVKEEDLGFEKNYSFHILAGDQVIGEGEGSSKKKAEQNASKDALDRIENQEEA